MTQYDKDATVPFVTLARASFPHSRQRLGRDETGPICASRRNEKYGSYVFLQRRKKAIPGEESANVPSPKVATLDLKPKIERRAKRIGDVVTRAIEKPI